MQRMRVQWRLSDITEQISKIAPWRPGFQQGYHGYITTGTINSLSAPNLVWLEQLQADRQTVRDEKRKMEENKVMQDESVFLFWMGKQKEGWNEKTGLYHHSQQGETEGGFLSQITAGTQRLNIQDLMQDTYY